MSSLSNDITIVAKCVRVPCSVVGQLALVGDTWWDFLKYKEGKRDDKFSLFTFRALCARFVVLGSPLSWFLDFCDTFTDQGSYYAHPTEVRIRK